jgi:hypothetical protein
MCWVNDQTLAIWGYGRDDEWLIPAAKLCDAATGNKLKWFAGPEIADQDDLGWREGLADARGALFFDRYLFSSSSRYGLGVWDVADGARVHHDAQLAPIRYHPRTREFLSILPEGVCRCSRLVQSQSD